MLVECVDLPGRHGVVIVEVWGYDCAKSGGLPLKFC